MHKSLLYALLLFLVFAAEGTANSTIEKLRELDAKKKEGLVSDADYDEQWKKIMEEAFTELSHEPRQALQVKPSQLKASEPKRYEVVGLFSLGKLDAGGTDVDYGAIDLHVGYFATPNLEILVGGTYLLLDVDPTSIDVIMLGGGIDYHFVNQGRFSIYGGAGVDWARVDIEDADNDDDFAWNARVGCRQIVGENVAIRYQVAYQAFDDLELDGIVLSAGLSFLF